MTVAVEVLAAVSFVFSKTPILLLYTRLFGVKTWLRICSYVTLTCLTILVLASAIVTCSVCTTYEDNVAPSFIARCTLWSGWGGVASGVLSLVVDIVILVLPISIISQLHLQTYKKIGLGLVFASGIL